MYQAVDHHKQPIIHAVYPSADAKRTYVLCHQDQKETALNFLHDIEVTIDNVFVPQAKAVYAPRLGGKAPYIQGYPKIDQRTRSYVKTLIDLTGNPQDLPPPQ